MAQSKLKTDNLRKILPPGGELLSPRILGDSETAAEKNFFKARFDKSKLMGRSRRCHVRIF
jgi:hypothetical protein